MIKKIAVIALTLLSSYVYPEYGLEQFEYYGEIIYQGSGSIQGYTINRYNNRKNLARKEFYNKSGYLTRYIAYQYDDTENLILEKTYNRRHNVIKKVSYKYRNGELKMKSVETKRQKFYVYYDKAYFDHKPFYTIETYYKLDIHDDTSFYLKKKKAFSYKGNKKIVKNYVLYPSTKQSDFQLTSIEVYKSYREGKLWAIELYSPNRQLKKTIEFTYRTNFETGLENIKRVNIYHVNSDYYHLTSGKNPNKTLTKSFVYEYNSNAFSIVKGFESGDILADSKKEKELTYIEPKKNSTTQNENTDPDQKSDIDEINDTIFFLEEEIERFKQLKKEKELEKK